MTLIFIVLQSWKQTKLHVKCDALLSSIACAPLAALWSQRMHDEIKNYARLLPFITLRSKPFGLNKEMGQRRTDRV